MGTQWGPPPPDDAGELAHLLFRQDNALSRRQAERFFTASAIRHRLASGRWQQAHRGVYLVGTPTQSPRQRRWVAVLAAPRGAVTAGLTALAQHGMRGFDREGAVHLLVPSERRDRDTPAGVLVHRTRHLPTGDVHRPGVPPCTMPARSLVDAAQWSPTDDRARAIIAAGFQQRLVAEDEIRQVLKGLRWLPRRAVIATATADASEGAHSLPEMRFLRLCRRACLPAPQLQVRRRDHSGRRRYLDAYWPKWQLHVEIDGSHHTDARAWWADMRRQNELWVAGDRVLRFPAWVVRDRPEEVAAAVRAALLAAGWRP